MDEAVLRTAVSKVLNGIWHDWQFSDGDWDFDGLVSADVAELLDVVHPGWRLRLEQRKFIYRSVKIGVGSSGNVWFTQCSAHGQLFPPEGWPEPHSADVVAQHDLIIMVAWDHERRFHDGPDSLTGGPGLVLAKNWGFYRGDELLKQPRVIDYSFT